MPIQRKKVTWRDEQFAKGMLSVDEQRVLGDQLKVRWAEWLSIYADTYPEAKRIQSDWVYWIGQGLRENSCSWQLLESDLVNIDSADEETRYQAFYRLKYLEEFICRVSSPTAADKAERSSGKHDGLNIVGHGLRGLSRKRVR